MAQVITIANNKGGTGKTTTAVNLSAALRLRGYDVLIVDYDGQANVTDILRVPTSGGTVYDAMKTPRVSYIEPVRVLGPEVSAGVLDVLPSCSDLSALDVYLADQPDRLTRFGAVVGQYRDKYDFIVIDTTPNIGLLTISALYAADNLIVTIQPQFLAVKGLLSLCESLGVVNENKAQPLGVRVLFTQYDKRKGLHRMTAEQVEGAGYNTFGTRIRDNVALGESTAVGLDIFRYNPSCNGARDYEALAAEYLEGSKIRHTKHGYR